MGDKIEAKRCARVAGVPTTPGSDGAVGDAGDAARVAREIGFPVLLKASAGGGGRGMRIVERGEDLERLLREAMGEAAAAFGDPAIYVEKYLTNVRHIEIQVLGDGRRAVHLGERDCSTQRRNQKLVEESPSPVARRHAAQPDRARPRSACASTSAIAARAPSSSSSTRTAASSTSWR